jgi:beta-lactamase superfamily II metal-dependent hydrolase
LIDSGEAKYADRVIDYLSRLGVNKLDLIIATHPHSDHIGGMDRIIAAVNTERLIMPEKSHTTATFERMLNAIDKYNVKAEYAKAGQEFKFDNFFIEIHSPNPNGSFDSINDFSILARVVHGDNVFLFTGDMEKAAEDDVLARKVDISANVLKVAHHGSRTSSQRRFLDAVYAQSSSAGKYAVINVAADNTYNHPNDEVVKRLELIGFEILRTDQLGTIVFVSTAEGIEVVT